MNRTNQNSTLCVHPAAIELLTEATWDFAKAILWPNLSFNSAEVLLSKIFIREYYESIPAERFAQTASAHFSGYCERVLMAKRYLDRFDHRYIPHPCIWLNKRNPKGFAGTKAWYDRLLQKRRAKQAQVKQETVYVLITSDPANVPFKFTA